MRLSIVANGDEHPVTAHGITTSASAAPDRWWGFVDFQPVSAPRSITLGLRALVDDGGQAFAELGTLKLEPGGVSEPVRGRDPASDPGEPLIAICMATFEPPLDLFERQIESIRVQTHRNWICVVSDDGSSPDRLAEIQRIIGDDPRFQLSAAPERQGFYANFERALRLAPAEAQYVALADQDDRWYPDKLEVLATALESGATLVYSDMRVVDGKDRVISETYWRYRRNNHTDFTSLLIANTITGAAALFRRELVETALPFPPPFGEIFHDAWIALVAMATGEVGYVSRPLYDYVQHHGAAIGFEKANLAGRRGGGGRIKRLLIRLLRLGWRIVRPVGQIRYFDNYCPLALEARVLELRCGRTMTPAKRGGLRRVLACEDSVRGVGWLALRSLRPLFGANETMGVERGLLAGILWRRMAARRASLRGVGARVRRGLH